MFRKSDLLGKQPNILPSALILNCPVVQLTSEAPFFTLWTEASVPCTQEWRKYRWAMKGRPRDCSHLPQCLWGSFPSFFLSSPSHMQASPEVWFSLHSASQSNFPELSHPLPNFDSGFCVSSKSKTGSMCWTSPQGCTPSSQVWHSTVKLSSPCPTLPPTLSSHWSTCIPFTSPLGVMATQPASWSQKMKTWVLPLTPSSPLCPHLLYLHNIPHAHSILPAHTDSI